MTFEKIKIQDAIMVAQSGVDVAATSMQTWWFGDTSATGVVGYIYTDRPVYRPTHEVQFKGILRTQRAGDFSPDVPGPVAVQVTDPTQKTIFQQDLELSP